MKTTRFTPIWSAQKYTNIQDINEKLCAFEIQIDYLTLFATHPLIVDNKNTVYVLLSTCN